MLPMLPNVHEAVGFMLAKTCKPGPSFVSLTTDHPTWEVSKQNSNRNIGLVFLVCLFFFSAVQSVAFFWEALPFLAKAT